MHHCRRNLFLSIFFLVTYSIKPVLASESLSVTRISENTLRIQCRFPEPVIHAEGTNSGQRSLVANYMENILLVSSETSLRIKEVSSQVGIIHTEFPAVLVEDIPIGMENESNDSSLLRNPTGRIWEESVIGRLDGRSVYRITFSPYNVIQSHSQFRWMQELILEVEGRDVEQMDVKMISHITPSLQPSKVGTTAKAMEKESTLLVFEDDQPRLKIWVEKEGIYWISRSLITKAGWDISSVDPRKVQVIGRLGEIPIRVVGEAIRCT